jgi:pSer/pThr/pTyr-binding forkhead associated (FHA) protein
MTTARVSMPQVFLVMQSTGQQIRLMGPATVIGRDADCTLQLEELTVAERHCQVLIDARTGEVAVEDLGSVGGTYVNRRPVKRCRLNDGDQLDVGGHVFKIRLPRSKSG